MRSFQYLLIITLVLVSSIIHQTLAQNTIDSIKILIGTEKVDRDHALAADYKPIDLVQIEQKWNYHEEDYKKFVRTEVKDALLRMLIAAEREGIHLKVVSAYRSYQKQKQLYNRAIKKHGHNQNTTAKPGYSEHQLGTTVDLSTSDPSTVLEQSFDQTNAGKWLKKNSKSFGFYQSYTVENSKQTGYIPEPWHYRYLGKTK